MVTCNGLQMYAYSMKWQKEFDYFSSGYNKYGFFNLSFLKNCYSAMYLFYAIFCTNSARRLSSRDISRRQSPIYSRVFPLGIRYFPSRLTNMTNVCSGRLISQSLVPSDSIPGVTLNSFIAADTSSGRSILNSLDDAVSDSPSHLAMDVTDVPCIINDSIVIKNTRLNINLACSTPGDIRAYVANIIGTAPRSPTQLIYTRALNVNLRKAANDTNTATGRAISIINTPRHNPGHII